VISHVHFFGSLITSRKASMGVEELPQVSDMVSSLHKSSSISFGKPNRLLQNNSSGLLRRGLSSMTLETPMPAESDAESHPTDEELPQIPLEDDQEELPVLTQLDRIPSSSSPSPMKLQPTSSMKGSRKSHTISPIKVAPPTKEATKMLQDNIISLLGKRPSNAEDEGGATGRGKRARPTARSKVCDIFP
jgi:hypothetical protein